MIGGGGGGGGEGHGIQGTSIAFLLQYLNKNRGMNGGTVFGHSGDTVFGR